MKPVSWRVVTAVALVAAAGGAAVSAGLKTFGRGPLILTPWLGLLFLVLGGIILTLGIGVKRMKANKDSFITPIQAASVAMFARSSLISGAGFSGFFVGVGVLSLFRLWAPSMAASALGAAIAFLGAAIMTAVAGVVEHWCLDDSGSSGHREAK